MILGAVILVRFPHPSGPRGKKRPAVVGQAGAARPLGFLFGGGRGGLKMRVGVPLAALVCLSLVGCGRKTDPQAASATTERPARSGATPSGAQPSLPDGPAEAAPSGKAAALPADKVRAATKLLGRGGDVKVEGFSSFESARDFKLASISRMVGEEDGLQRAAKALADYDPAAYLFVLANARHPVKELTDVLGPAEKTTTAEESFRIPEATEVGLQHRVSVTWHEYDWFAFASVDGKIVAARVLPKKFVASQKAK